MCLESTLADVCVLSVRKTGNEITFFIFSRNRKPLFSVVYLFTDMKTELCRTILRASISFSRGYIYHKSTYISSFSLSLSLPSCSDSKFIIRNSHKLSLVCCQKCKWTLAFFFSLPSCLQGLLIPR